MKLALPDKEFSRFPYTQDLNPFHEYICWLTCIYIYSINMFLFYEDEVIVENGVSNRISQNLSTLHSVN